MAWGVDNLFSGISKKVCHTCWVGEFWTHTKLQFYTFNYIVGKRDDTSLWPEWQLAFPECNFILSPSVFVSVNAILKKLNFVFSLTTVLSVQSFWLLVKGYEHTLYFSYSHTSMSALLVCKLILHTFLFTAFMLYNPPWISKIPSHFGVKLKSHWNKTFSRFG